MALEFTRVQTAKLKAPAATELKGRQASSASITLDTVLSWKPIGRHPGHDCFVVPRHLVPPAMVASDSGLVAGMPPWGTM